MVEVYSIVGTILGIFIISNSLLRLRKQKISQGTFTLWIIVGVVITLVAVIPTLIFSIQAFLNTEFTLSAVLGLSIVFLVLLVFYLHQKVDMLNQKIMKLIAELASNQFYKSYKKDD